MDNQNSKGLIIYYFSGTGNAEKVAEWFRSEAIEQGKSCDLIDIATLPDRKKIYNPQSSRVGFISPTHGFNFPPIMMHFIMRFPRAKKQQAFIINTRAGMKMGKLFLPGISGIAQWFSALILLLKGYKIQAMRSIDLPSNWISLHPGIKPKVIDSIFEHRKKQTITLAQKVLNNKQSYNTLIALPIDIALLPIAIVYYFFGRFFLAKMFYASSACTACMACVKSCPIKAIKMVDNRPFWKYECESCMRCMNLCPHRAIEVSHGFAFLLFFVFDSILLVWLYKTFAISELYQELLPNWLVSTLTFLINWTVILFLYLGSYRLMHFLLRYKAFEKAMLYTSLSFYKFWRRYKPGRRR